MFSKCLCLFVYVCSLRNKNNYVSTSRIYTYVHDTEFNKWILSRVCSLALSRCHLFLAWLCFVTGLWIYFWKVPWTSATFLDPVSCSLTKHFCSEFTWLPHILCVYVAVGHCKCASFTNMIVVCVDLKHHCKVVWIIISQQIIEGCG